MPITLPPALIRTNYFAWPPGPGDMYDPNADPDNPSADPSQADAIGEVVFGGNAATDEEQYFRPLERLHGMGLHAPGVAYGMQLICTLGDSTVQITPGIALDPSGKHIFLASGGAAAVGPDTDVVGSFPATIGVNKAGAILDTTGNTGDYYVIAQWWESWNSGQYYDSGVNTYTDTPWLQLVTAGDYDPEIHIPLGKVSLDGSSNVTAASYGDVGGIQRTSVSVPVQSVQLIRAETTASGTIQGADTVSWGEVRAREGGGIELVTENDGDQVNVITQSGGTFSSMAVAANSTAFGPTSNPSIVLDAASATASIGGKDTDGTLSMYDFLANETMYLDGKSGTTYLQNLNAFQNGLIDINTTFFHCHGTDLCLDGRSHNNNRALVDWGNLLIINYAGDYKNGVEINGAGLKVDGNTTSDGTLTVKGNFQGSNGTFSGNLTVDGTLYDGNGNPLEGNPARKLQMTWPMSAGSEFNGLSTSQTADIDLGYATQFSALIVPQYLQEYVDYSYNAATAVEVIQVDGNPTPTVATLGISGAGDPNLYVSAYSGNGRVITFRTRGMDNSIEIMATGIVYYE